MDEALSEKIRNSFSDRIEEIKEGTLVPSFDQVKNLPEFSGINRDEFIFARDEWFKRTFHMSPNNWYKQNFHMSFNEYSSIQMSQSDLINMFDCPSSGNKGAVYFIKLIKDQILVKHRCPPSKGRLLRIPLILKDQCISHFQDTVFRCYKCGQEASVDHMKFSGPWALIKLSCPTHGNNLPYHRIWSTIFTEISNEGSPIEFAVKSGRQMAIDSISQSVVDNMFTCRGCGSILTTFIIKLEKDQIVVKQKCPTHAENVRRIPLSLKDQCISHFQDTVFRCYRCGQVATVDRVKRSGPWILIKLSCPSHGNKIPTHKIWSSVYYDISNEGIATPQQVLSENGKEKISNQFTARMKMIKERSISHARKIQIKRKNNTGMTFLILGALSILLAILLLFVMPREYYGLSYGGGYGVFLYMSMVIGIILTTIGIILVSIKKNRDKKVDSMSQSDLAKLFDCPGSGIKSVVHFIKLVEDQILVKKSCPTLYPPNNEPKLLKIPLRLKDQCVSYFRDAIFRCFTCGQKATVDHVKFSGPWTLIKLSCPTHGNMIPTHKIWSTVYSDISNGVNIIP